MNKNNQRNATEFDGLFFIVMMELYTYTFIEVTIVNDNSSHQSSYL